MTSSTITIYTERKCFLDLYMRNIQMVGNTNRVILLAMMEFELFVPRSKPRDLRY